MQKDSSSQWIHVALKMVLSLAKWLFPGNKKKKKKKSVIFKCVIPTQHTNIMWKVWSHYCSIYLVFPLLFTAIKKKPPDTVWRCHKSEAWRAGCIVYHSCVFAYCPFNKALILVTFWMLTVNTYLLKTFLSPWGSMPGICAEVQRKINLPLTSEGKGDREYLKRSSTAHLWEVDLSQTQSRHVFYLLQKVHHKYSNDVTSDPLKRYFEFDLAKISI